jgi:hypothetical protein
MRWSHLTSHLTSHATGTSQRPRESTLMLAICHSQPRVGISRGSVRGMHSGHEPCLSPVRPFARPDWTTPKTCASLVGRENSWLRGQRARPNAISRSSPRVSLGFPASTQSRHPRRARRRQTGLAPGPRVRDSHSESGGVRMPCHWPNQAGPMTQPRHHTGSRAVHLHPSPRLLKRCKS